MRFLFYYYTKYSQQFTIVIHQSMDDFCIVYFHCFQFLLIYKKAHAGELEQDSGLGQLARLTEVNVDEVGVTGAKNFFEAKVN